MTEIHLPFFDGHALCELLRRDSTTRSVPILVVTTERDRAQLERAPAAGADACLVKPATLDALFNQIRHLLAPSSASHRTRATARATTAAEHHEYAASTPACFDRHLGRVRSRAHLWFEHATPPERPPSLVCPSCDRHSGTIEVTLAASGLAIQNNGTSSCARLPNRAEYSSIDNGRVNSGVFADLVTAADQFLFESEAAVERCAGAGITPRHGDWDRPSSMNTVDKTKAS